MAEVGGLAAGRLAAAPGGRWRRRSGPRRRRGAGELRAVAPRRCRRRRPRARPASRRAPRGACGCRRPSRAPARAVGDVAADVDLALAGVQARHGGDAGAAARRRMSSASACSDDTRNSGTPVGSASPLTAASPTRRPVKLPGPPPQAIPASSGGRGDGGPQRLRAQRQARGWSAARRSPRPRSGRPPPVEHRHPRGRRRGVEAEKKIARGVRASHRGSRKRTTSLRSANTISITTTTSPT